MPLAFNKLTSLEHKKNSYLIRKLQFLTTKSLETSIHEIEIDNSSKNHLNLQLGSLGSGLSVQLVMNALESWSHCPCCLPLGLSCIHRLALCYFVDELLLLWQNPIDDNRNVSALEPTEVRCLGKQRSSNTG
ncbi:hypothetical protein O6H91_22G014500 [Diphasiastrum complanatum]|uniref:Uncharacterized protein n=1 Tax=Diphasiastrum complanatum TaxID=34168 RepID=A0ACC2AD37_DIPCM|nr:hypothetical protein O6H91_22G014500 [Diphasiastrum complanatum]